MARPRKQKYDPRQHSFMFDIMADQIEHIRVENIQANLEQPVKVVLQDSSPPYVRLGLNNNGVAVYTLKEGGRMVSRDPAIMQTVDGDKDTPESLYTRGKQQYLTVEELAAFTKGQPLTREAQHGSRQTDSPAGNSPHRAEARNNPGSKERGVYQFSLLDFGQMGAEPTGRTESPGSEGGNSVRQVK